MRNFNDIGTETRVSTSTRATSVSTDRLQTKMQEVDEETRRNVEKRASRRESRRRSHSSPPTSPDSDEPVHKRGRPSTQSSKESRNYDSLMMEMLALRQTVSEVNQRTIVITQQMQSVLEKTIQAKGDSPKLVKKSGQAVSKTVKTRKQEAATESLNTTSTRVTKSTKQKSKPPS